MSLVDLANAWKENIMHIIYYFQSLKVTPGSNGWAVCMIYTVIVMLVIIMAVFAATKGRR